MNSMEIVDLLMDLDESIQVVDITDDSHNSSSSSQESRGNIVPVVDPTIISLNSTMELDGSAFDLIEDPQTPSFHSSMGSDFDWEALLISMKPM